MTIGYNRTLVGIGALTLLAIAGGTLLGFGLSGDQLVKWGGHTWQVITGSSLLAIGAVGALGTGALLIYAKKLKSVDLVKKALQQDSRIEIWAYADKKGKRVMVSKNNEGKVNTIKLQEISDAIQKWHSRVFVVPFLINGNN